EGIGRHDPGDVDIGGGVDADDGGHDRVGEIRHGAVHFGENIEAVEIEGLGAKEGFGGLADHGTLDADGGGEGTAAEQVEEVVSLFPVDESEVEQPRGSGDEDEDEEVKGKSGHGS